MAGTLSLPALDSWYNLQHIFKTHSVTLYAFKLILAFTTRGWCCTNLCVSETELVFIWSKRDFFFAASPVNTSNTFLYNALDLLEHVGVFFVDPVGQVATIIQDLIGWKRGQKGWGTEKSTAAFFFLIFVSWINVVTMLGCQPSTLTHRSMHHQKSSSDSPFHANTLKPRRRQCVLCMVRQRPETGLRGRSEREKRQV